MRFTLWTLFLFVLWMMLTSSLALDNILIGALVSSVVALFYINLFPDMTRTVSIRPLGLIYYLFVLFKNLLISNLQISKKILSKNIEIAPAIVAVKTELTCDWKKLLLANSVTLTPGTLTLDIKEDILYVHVIDYQLGSDKHEIIAEFEQAIAKI